MINTSTIMKAFGDHRPVHFTEEKSTYIVDFGDYHLIFHKDHERYAGCKCNNECIKDISMNDVVKSVELYFDDSDDIKASGFSYGSRVIIVEKSTEVDILDGSGCRLCHLTSKRDLRISSSYCPGNSQCLDGSGKHSQVTMLYKMYFPFRGILN